MIAVRDCDLLQDNVGIPHIKRVYNWLHLVYVVDLHCAMDI